MNGLAIRGSEVVVGFVQSLDESVADTVRGGHIRLLQPELGSGEGAGVVGMVFDVRGDPFRTVGRRIHHRLHCHTQIMHTTLANFKPPIYCTFLFS